MTQRYPALKIQTLFNFSIPIFLAPILLTSIFCATIALAASGKSIGVQERSQDPIAQSPPKESSQPTIVPTVINPGPVLHRLDKPPEAIGLDAAIFSSKAHRKALITAIDRSLSYLTSFDAARAYSRYPISGITRDRVIRSLRRFKTLVQIAKTPEALRQQVKNEFIFYQSAGNDSQGTVEFTGYFEPVYIASRRPSAEFRYPLYRRPYDFDRWSRPHPTRSQLEGKDGLQANQGKLHNGELVWMRDRLQAFLVQVQGSARLSLTDGSTMTIGFDGNTDYPYVSLGKELVKDGKFKLEELTLPRLSQYLQENPAELDEYLPRNNRFVFFRNTQGALATGSLGVAVTDDRSIATDKKLMPPGALALIDTELPNAQLQSERVGQFVLDQDTGGAIVGPGRVDIFMGTGDSAKARAGLVRSTGKLYYLILKK